MRRRLSVSTVTWAITALFLSSQCSLGFGEDLENEVALEELDNELDDSSSFLQLASGCSLKGREAEDVAEAPVQASAKDLEDDFESLLQTGSVSLKVSHQDAHTDLESLLQVSKRPAVLQYGEDKQPSQQEGALASAHQREVADASTQRAQATIAELHTSGGSARPLNETALQATQINASRRQSTLAALAPATLVKPSQESMEVGEEALESMLDALDRLSKDAEKTVTNMSQALLSLNATDAADKQDDEWKDFYDYLWRLRGIVGWITVAMFFILIIVAVAFPVSAKQKAKWAEELPPDTPIRAEIHEAS